MCFYATARAPGRGLHRHGRFPVPRGHLQHSDLVLQHPAQKAGHPHIEGGLNEGKWQPMVLLTKLKYKEATAWDGGIGEAITVTLTRLRLLPVCVEGSQGQNGLFGGFMMERDGKFSDGRKNHYFSKTALSSNAYLKYYTPISAIRKLANKKVSPRKGLRK